jgi:hypothetical protein
MTQSSPPPPPNLDYRPPEPRGSRNPWATNSLKLLAGFGAGVLLSTAVWVFGWNPLPRRGSDSVAYTVLGIKTLACVVLMFIPGWRSLGAGVLLSIGVGVLIFIGTCGGNF